jgi:unsaturated rhamnogalacturonyl hydrolase
MKFFSSFLLIAFVFVEMGCASSKKTASAGFNPSFPAGTSPQEIGKRIAQRYIELPYQNFNRPTPPKVISYPEDCAWYGALNFAKLTNDALLRQQLIDRFQPLFGSRDTLLPKPDHVDYTVFGSVPLELYIQTREQKYLDLGKRYADKQWEKPEGTSCQ